jgi:AbiV family abortive infection protein
MEFNEERLKAAGLAAIANGKRLLDDAEWLNYDTHRTSAHFLTLIAQEEYAKAFLLGMVIRRVIPWDRRLLRAARDHACKQLVCIVMDYLHPDDDEFSRRIRKTIDGVYDRELPRKVADAINILRHEKIGRMDNRYWVWDEDPDYDREALAVADGKQDRQKQGLLYVRLASDGGVASTPQLVSKERLLSERERAQRMSAIAEAALDLGGTPGLDYGTVEEIMKAVFTPYTEVTRTE